MLWVFLTNYLLCINKMDKIFESTMGTFPSSNVQVLDPISSSSRIPLKVTAEQAEEEDLVLDVHKCFEGVRGTTSKGSTSMTLDLGVVIVVPPMNPQQWEQLRAFFFSKGLSLTLEYLWDPYLNIESEYLEKREKEKKI